MVRAERTAFDPHETYLHLQGDGTGIALEVGPDFWQKTITTLQGGWLVTAGHATRDWPHWEMHPQGEELIYVMSGAIELVVEDDEGEHVVPLNPGQLYLMRRGVWHRARVKVPSQTLFVTFGEGTQHRPV